MDFVVRPEAEERREASFENFDATTLSSRLVKSSKNDKYFVIGTPTSYESKTDMFMSLGELSNIQDKNPKSLILINAEGKVAKVGEECVLNPKAYIARIDGVIEYASKAVEETVEA